MHRIDNPEGVKASRGFESHPLHFGPPQRWCATPPLWGPELVWLRAIWWPIPNDGRFQQQRHLPPAALTGFGYTRRSRR